MKDKALASQGFLPPESASVPNDFPGRFIPGGRNVEAYRYFVTPGYPPYPDRAKWIGLLSGSWSQMGEELGARAGDKVRCTSDIWWGKICQAKGKADTLKAMKLYEAQIAALDPGQIDFLKGIASGAAPWLNQSIYASTRNDFFAENYWRVLTSSIWDCWYWGTPQFPVAGGCNSFAVLGPATTIGKTIAVHARHTPHDGLCYQQAYVLKPPEGNLVWTVAPTPGVCGNLVVNNKGVSIHHHLGGKTNKRSLRHPQGPFNANAFGVPWLNLILYASIHANTAKEAIELLTIGPQNYLKKTGRKSILRDGVWNWMVTDSHTLAVVEASADRYAVRYAGEYLGSEWAHKNYIACANHSICEFSYDENNNLTDVPMTIFNDPVPGTPLGLSPDRFWTLMWDLKDRDGLIDRYMAQHIIHSTYKREKETGKILQCAQRQDREWDLYAYVEAGVQGIMADSGRAGGTNICGLTVLDGSHSLTSWNLGNPSDWEGAWDEYHFSNNQ
jgi:hypothetical protein